MLQSKTSLDLRLFYALHDNERMEESWRAHACARTQPRARSRSLALFALAAAAAATTSAENQNAKLRRVTIDKNKQTTQKFGVTIFLLVPRAAFCALASTNATIIEEARSLYYRHHERERNFSAAKTIRKFSCCHRRSFACKLQCAFSCRVMERKSPREARRCYDRKSESRRSPTTTTTGALPLARQPSPLSLFSLHDARFNWRFFCCLLFFVRISTRCKCQKFYKPAAVTWRENASASRRLANLSSCVCRRRHRRHCKKCF